MPGGVRTGWRLLAGTAAVAALASCSEPTVCSTIGWSNGLRIEVDPALPAASVRVECRGCGVVGGSEEDVATAPLTGRSAELHLGMTTPGSVDVALLDAAGSVLRETETEPDWRRVGGSEECGGPSEATVVVS